jgi:hypothetical protein
MLEVVREFRRLMFTLKDNSPSPVLRVARAAVWILAIAIVVLSLVPRDLRFETNGPSNAKNL